MSARDKLLEMYGRNRFDSGLMTAISLLSLCVGWICLYWLAGYFWFGLSIALILFGGFQLARSLRAYILAGKRSKAVQPLDEEAASIFAAMDMHRIKAAIRKHRNYLRGSSGLLILGLLLLLGGLVYQRNGFAIGTGIGVMLQTGFVVVYEMIYIWRHEIYKRELEKLIQT